MKQQLEPTETIAEGTNSKLSTQLLTQQLKTLADVVNDIYIEKIKIDDFQSQSITVEKKKNYIRKMILIKQNTESFNRMV